MPELEIHGTTIRYQEQGKGVPVVLIPGGRWGGYGMDEVAGQLAKECGVVTRDRHNTAVARASSPRAPNRRPICERITWQDSSACSGSNPATSANTQGAARHRYCA